MIEDFFHIVVQTADVAATAAAYRAHLEYEDVESGVIAPTLATDWGFPAAAGRRQALLRPSSGADCYIRFVEGDAPSPLGSVGWNGVELLVEDLDATQSRLVGSPFKEFNPPQQLSLSPNVRFMQVLGPGGELVFLNQMDEPKFGVGRALSPVDRPFCMVCGVRDVGAMLAWVEATLGVRSEPPVAVTMPGLNRMFGLDPQAQHPLAFVKTKGPFILEFDGYPPQAANKPHEAGQLPGGYSFVSCSVADLDALPAPLAVRARVRSEAPYQGARAVMLRGPEDLVLEVVERRRSPPSPADCPGSTTL